VEPYPPNAARPPRARLTPRDLELLAFAAEHRLILADHARALLGMSAEASRTRLGTLARAGYLTAQQAFHHRARCFQIARPGLDAIASDLGPPRRLDLRSYDHEAGAAWLWLAAGAARFGDVREVLGERRMRSLDARPEREGPPLGVRLGGTGPRGQPRIHYPDLLLITPGGHRIALELELSSKGRVRREKILAGYGADARIDAVLYLVKDRRIGRSIQESARRVGITALVHVQRVSFPADGAAGAAGRASGRVRVPAESSATTPVPAESSPTGVTR
jgi:hypothetical protein